MPIKSRRFAGVLFDLDGTLLDTLVDIAAAMNEVLVEDGFPPIPEPVFRRLVGDGMEGLMDKALAEVGAAGRPTGDLLARYRQSYDRRWPEHSAPYPGISELLLRLSRAGLPKAVLSNKADDFVRQMTETLLPGAGLWVVRGRLPGVPRKPDPTAALKLAVLLGQPPGQMAFVGDSGVDIETGLAAGMTPLGVLWGYRDRQELVSAGARELFASPGDLGDYLLG